MQGEKSKKYEKVMSWLALIVMVVTLVSTLLLPLIQGENVGPIYGAVLDKQIYRSYEYNSTYDYYRLSGTELYGDDYEYDNDDWDYDDKYFDDSEYRASAEKEARKIKRDVKHVNEFKDSISFGKEIQLMIKYIKYVVTASEEELIGFRYSLCAVALLLCMAIILAVYLLISFIITLLNLLTKKIDLEKIQRRVCRILFFLVPFLIVVNWQRDLTVNFFYSTSRKQLFWAGGRTSLGIGCILPCILIALFLIVYWAIHVHRRVGVNEGAEQFVIKHLVFFMMMTAAGIALLLNSAMALQGDLGSVSVSNLAAKSAYMSSNIKYRYELYELEHEDTKDEDDWGDDDWRDDDDWGDDDNWRDEDDKDDNDWRDRVQKKSERLFEDMSEVNGKRLFAGFLAILGVLFTIQIFCCMNKVLYRNQDSVRYRFWAAINVALYLTVYLLLLWSNSLEMEYYLEYCKDVLSDSDKMLLAGESVGGGILFMILLHASILVADIWRKLICRRMNKCSIQSIGNLSGGPVTCTPDGQEHTEPVSSVQAAEPPV